LFDNAVVNRLQKFDPGLSLANLVALAPLMSVPGHRSSTDSRLESHEETGAGSSSKPLAVFSNPNRRLNQAATTASKSMPDAFRRRTLSRGAARQIDALGTVPLAS
jgi:hypothetical protein